MKDWTGLEFGNSVRAVDDKVGSVFYHCVIHVPNQELIMRVMCYVI